MGETNGGGNLMDQSNCSASTLADFGNDGRAVLRFIIECSPWRSLNQALASLSSFAHPDVVKAVGARAIFRTARTSAMITRGQVVDGVLLDDNHSPAKSPAEKKLSDIIRL